MAAMLSEHMRKIDAGEKKTGLNKEAGLV